MTTLPADKVGVHTWAVSTRHVGGKVGIVVGSEATLVVDGGADPAEGAAVAETAICLGRGRSAVVFTHGHWDHVRGWAGMPDVEAIIHADAWPSARTQLTVSAQQVGAIAGTRPATVIDGPWTRDLGGVTIEVLETPGHAPGSVSVRVIEDGVLFGGDTVVTAIPPVFTDGHSTILERTLRRVAMIDLEVLVPGHGQVVRGLPRIRETILRSAGYLADTRERIGSLFGPHGADEVAAMLSVRRGARGPFDAGLVPTPDLALRHERMVRALIDEVGLRPADRPDA